MIKPLWDFFLFIKDRTQIQLSIDQYYYFFVAIQNLQDGQLTTYSQLRKYCKIFWLPNQQYEKEFNWAFSHFVDWEEIKNIFSSTKGTEDNENVKGATSLESNEIEDNDTERDDDDNDIDENLANAPSNPISSDIFELIMSENKEGIESKEGKLQDWGFKFSLNDQSIMPFNLRYFAQRLRREVETIEKEQSDELDLEVMISQYCKNKYIEEITYQFKDSSKSNIILLADRHGSMLAYEYIENQLREAITTIPDCKFEHYFFANLPLGLEDSAHYLLDEVKKGLKGFDTSEHKWDEHSWFFILSDAGAHSGMVNRDRLRETLKLWQYFQNISPHVYWLNPVPEKYQHGTTAERLSFIIPMIYPYKDDLIAFFNKL